MHKVLFLILIGISITYLGQYQKDNPIWIGKSNRITNPGAESNWVSPHGVTSHEWNHDDKKLGLPTNPGNNYFRLTVNKYEETRKINLF